MELLSREREQIKGLVSDISHQTKTPMTNIRMYTELLLEHLKQTQDENGRKTAEEILRQVQRMDFLISCFVKISRLESGIVKVQPKEQDVCALAAEAAEALRMKAALKNIRIVYEKREPVSACFDWKWTKEALENVIDNAVKYSGEKTSIRITVTSFEMYARIAVKDQGMGILEEEIPKIFERFYRGSGVHAQEGAGIGLFLAREIVKREDGYMKVQSVYGKGSVFSIYLLKELPHF